MIPVFSVITGILLGLLLLVAYSDAYQPSSIGFSTFNRHGIQQSTRSPTSLDASQQSKYPCRCPEDNDDESDGDESSTLEDRREAMFAMIGGVWATTTTAWSLAPNEASATYGNDAKMTFPNPMESMSDRTNKQCLVESLGNRECLVYQEDEEKLLYKGADVSVLLERVSKAAKALEYDIPPLVAAKKWTQITGVLTGPMGQLSSTLALIEKYSDQPSMAKQNAGKVKQDVFAMGTAVTNKQPDIVLKYQQLAIEDLATFLKSL